MSHPFSPKAMAYLQKVSDTLLGMSPLVIAQRVESLVKDHDGWRERCLNMNAAETVMSRRARAVLDSDMATRLTEGIPGDKLYPHGVQNDHIDEIEAVIISLLRRQFGAKHVEWRPVSVTMANAAAFFALLAPGDCILSQAEDGGGNYSYHAHGPAGLARLGVVPVPCNATFEIDLDALEYLAIRHRPKMIVVGGSNVLFPYPVADMRKIADQVGALLLYDAAHVALGISMGDFQRPLSEGAHLVSISTAKSIGGPLGGVLMTDDDDLATKILKLTFPGLVQTRDENKYAAQAIALAEMAEFGAAQAHGMLANAHALAAALEREGFKLLARERHYTRTHQIFLELGDTAQEFERRCQAANILVSDCALAGDYAWTARTGARLASHELTRLGMKEPEMDLIAQLIRRVTRDREPADRIASEVKALLERFPRLSHSFDGRP
jgi:glycine hydroxymethyltransferase